MADGPIGSDVQDALRQEVIRVTTEAAAKDNVAVKADGLAFLLDSDAMVVNAPMAGLEEIDFEAILRGEPVLDDKPIMYWHLSGTGLENSPVRAGFYTVVVHQNRGAISLRNADGTTVAQGNFSIELVPGEVPLISISGGIDSFKSNKKGFKLCGHVKVTALGASFELSGCIEVTRA
jgi:hypothetical protein